MLSLFLASLACSQSDVERIREINESVATTPTATVGPTTTIAPPLSPVAIATVAPLPSPVPTTTVALPSPVPIVTVALPSPVPIVTVAPPSPIPVVTVALPSPVPVATIALPSPVPVATVALPSPVPIATVAPPSPVPVATVALPSPVPVATVALPSPVPIATVAPPSPVPVATVALPSPVPIVTVALPSPVPVATVVPLATVAPTTTVTQGGLSAEIQVTEVTEGDCINSTLTEGISIETVVIVVCTGPWEYRVLGSFEVSGQGSYPGEGYFGSSANENCDRRFSDFLYPLEELWGAGDRTVSCLQASLGLSVVDPAKLDRLVGVNTVDLGECYNEAPETGGVLVELVDCSGPWEYRVLGAFRVVDQEKYPDKSFFEGRAFEGCDRRQSHFAYPLEESWMFGDRTVTCLQESFGLSVVDPAKLDRLVSSDTLSIGECYNEAPETGWVLVELVSCTDPWEYRVLGLFEVTDQVTYPGQSYFETRALESCDRRHSDFLYPFEELWKLGGRTVTCLQESFGLSVVDPAKLDRLVSLDSLETGECISRAPETDGMLVELVDCSGLWEFRILGILEVDDHDDFPGESYFERLAYENCDRRYTLPLYPAPESWILGDRAVSCLQQSFGLSVTDPAKLDRLVGLNTVDPEGCYNNAPETDGILVELVDCSGPWEYRVLGTFKVDDHDDFPGESYFDKIAYENCDRRYSLTLYPVPESWILGDRAVSCLQQSFGLSVTDPAKLDRLVALNAVDPGECYSEAPATDGILVELVDCSGPWEYQVVKAFNVPWDGEYPGTDYFEQQVDKECGDSGYFLDPSRWTWDLGNRVVLCIRASNP